MKISEITYCVGNRLGLDAVIEVYKSSGLGERRPVNNRECMRRMLLEASLVVSAWDGARLVGLARTLTDLLVRAEYQKRGIGRELIRRTREQLDAKAMIVLLAAPAAEEYYPRLGFARHPQAWILPTDAKLIGV